MRRNLNTAAMDINDNVGGFSQTSLIFLTFLHQTHPQDPEFQAELDRLCGELKITVVSKIEYDGELEVDGHSPSVPRSVIQDILPQGHLHLPVNNDDAHAIQEVAEELIRIADQLNHIIENQAESLVKKMDKNSSLQSWRRLLAQSVENLLQQVPGFHNERMVMALTFSLVKAVCERVPLFLRRLYQVLIQYTSFTQPR